MKIDLNADLGEGFGPYLLTDDDALLSIVSSANIACGMHAGTRRQWLVCAGWPGTGSGDRGAPGLFR